MGVSVTSCPPPPPSHTLSLSLYFPLSLSLSLTLSLSFSLFPTLSSFLKKQAELKAAEEAARRKEAAEGMGDCTECTVCDKTSTGINTTLVANEIGNNPFGPRLRFLGVM